MVDYNELRKKFPAKTPGKAARTAKALNKWFIFIIIIPPLL